MNNSLAIFARRDIPFTGTGMSGRWIRCVAKRSGPARSTHGPDKQFDGEVESLGV